MRPHPLISLLLAISTPISAQVLTGIDVLKRDGFAILKDRRVAVLTNHTGRDRDGHRTIDLLRRAPGVTVVKILSPEHGLAGAADEKVGDSVDPESNLPVLSLYGETLRPTDAMLEGIDTIVHDIQNLSARFYTRQTTLGYVMEAAAKHRIKVVVLDRPNPMTGTRVDGPLAGKNHLSFTAYAPIPVVHGMTIGELAHLFNGEYKIGCDLTVIPCENWRRDMWWDQTGLTWIPTSPNIRTPTQATLYPAIGLIETTNLSVGRGTDQPFEFVGAPWIDARKLAAALNAASLPGLRFVPIEFTPRSSKFANEKCNGIYIVITNRAHIEHTRTALTIAWHLRHLFCEAFDIKNVGKLLANDEVLRALITTNDSATLPTTWQKQLEEFMKVRSRYLLYP